MMKNETPYKKM